MIVACVNEKGGVGKSTIALQLGVLRAQQGRDVLFVDCDPAGHLAAACATRAENGTLPAVSCVSLRGQGAAAELRRLAERYDDIIVDCGQGDSVALRAALTVTNLCVIPVLPGSQEYRALVAVMAVLVEQARGFNPELRAVAVINKADTNPQIKIADELAEACEDLEGIELAKTRIGYRVAYRRAIADGVCVNELEKKDQRAVQEITDLYKEITND